MNGATSQQTAMRWRHHSLRIDCSATILHSRMGPQVSGDRQALEVEGHMRWQSDHREKQRQHLSGSWQEAAE